jgi:hypothetical protein
MSLGMVFKGPEGIVLGADSRVTLTLSGVPSGAAAPMLIPASYDNATKLLKVVGQDFVAAITYGVGAIGQASPRTAHSFLPEFEAELAQQPGRLPVEDYAARLGDFFNRQWQATMPVGVSTGNMVFLIAGYNENEAYGRVYQLMVPSATVPVEQNVNEFGLTYGGQTDISERILNRIDRLTIQSIAAHLNLAPNMADPLFVMIRQNQALKSLIHFYPSKTVWILRFINTYDITIDEIYKRTFAALVVQSMSQLSPGQRDSKMYRQNKSTANEPSVTVATYNVNGADWREAIRGMQFVNLSNYQTVSDRPSYRQTGDIRPMPTQPVGH